MPINYKNICCSVVDICIEAGKYIEEECIKFDVKLVEEKDRHNYVSYVDKTAEQIIFDKLLKLIPNSGFIAEESGLFDVSKEFIWIIDPLDGTTNFIHKVPIFCISIALQYKNKTVVGVVYEINKKEAFYAWDGGVAMLNNSKINVSNLADFSRSLLATGFPYTNYEYMNEYIAIFKSFMTSTSGLRRLGSAAADLAYTACGRFDGFYEYGLSPWDVAAGAFIVEKAGGIVTDFCGDDNFVHGAQIIAANKNVYIEMFKIISDKICK